ncbi:SAM-dependent methyltransferase [Emcibacter sp. SYSU 3D8]|uniref:class I SAM-dependent methyltransferase n=1 Tax=Emcibacter sp. SYSU 3D8 TaxID=3133969 RepID=UPI0031FF1CCC
MPTPLNAMLIARIREAGPLSVAEYMQAALADPAHGYYATRDPLGAAGDFITAPEISQIFGELIGLWVADCWDAMGRPRRLKIVELGPGRGTLMADVLRTLRVAPAMLPEPWLIETSPVLREAQRGRVDAHWADGLDEVPAGPMVLIANEFLDALPIRQFSLDADGWRERLVTAAADGSRLEWALGDARSRQDAGLPGALDSADQGSMAETCPAALALIRDVAARLVDQGGAALFVDYGTTTSRPGDSLQAVRGHRYHDPLEAPGQADLTAHVDFAALAAEAHAAGAVVHGPSPQSLFLEALGVFVRAQVLKRSATPEEAREIDLAVHRLTAPDQMGSLFKALALTDPHMPPPAGFS